MTMRIGFDASKIMPPRDGIGTYTSSLLRALAAADGDHRLRLYPTLHPVDPDLTHELLGPYAERVSVARAPGPEPGEVDLFHANTWIRPPRFRGPVLMTCYDLTVVSHPETHLLANRAHCLSGLLDAVLAGDRFLTLSDATAAELRAVLEVPRERVHVVPAAVDERFRAPDAEAIERTLASFGIAAPYVLAVGTRQPRKNLGRLLDAWSRMAERHDPVPRLVIVGAQGWGAEPGGAATDERPEVHARVHFLGHVADDALPALYAGAAVLAFPSLAEGFGFPVLEAMACGTPVVTSALSSLPEVAGDAAILVDPLDTGAIAQALSRVLGDATEAARLGAASRERSQSYSWARTAEGVLRVYAAMIAGERAAGSGQP